MAAGGEIRRRRAGRELAGTDCPGGDCNAGDPVPCLVLDPFAGTATVGKVCARLGRSFIGTELKLDYIDLAQERTREVQTEMSLTC